MPLPAAGSIAPPIALPNQDNRLTRLADLAGKPVLAWFFSRAFGSN